MPWTFSLGSSPLYLKSPCSLQPGICWKLKQGCSLLWCVGTTKSNAVSVAQSGSVAQYAIAMWPNESPHLCHREATSTTGSKVQLTVLAGLKCAILELPLTFDLNGLGASLCMIYENF